MSLVAYSHQQSSVDCLRMFPLGYQSYWTLVCIIFDPATLTDGSLDIVDFKGSTVVDCPSNLNSGASMIVSLSVYIKASAFKPPHAVPEEEKAKLTFINEGQETAAEQIFRERKSSLIHLFDILSLKPTTRGAFSKSKKAKLDDDDLKLLAQKKAIKAEKKKQIAHTEIVGDGEEIVVENDEEDLSENQLNLIYKKSVSFEFGWGFILMARTLERRRTTVI